QKKLRPPQKKQNISGSALYFSPITEAAALGRDHFRKFSEAPSKSYGRRDLILINAFVAYLSDPLAPPEGTPLRRAPKRSGEALASFTEAHSPQV
ncbi:MAG: hypothetical protein WAL20_12110, partial [Rhodomicrobium sp.]